jgi:hypothetical protein
LWAPLGAAHLDWHVLAFTAAVSIFAVVICGLAPALRILKNDSHAGLKSARGGIRDALVIAETSLAIVFRRRFRAVTHHSLRPAFRRPRARRN